MKKQLLVLLLTLLPMLAMADDSGSCGDNVTWTFTESTKTLTIQGSGAIDNFPWYGFRTNIQNIVIEDGVTSIGNQAFRDFSGLTSVTIPNSVTSIGSGAFEGCSGLTSVTIPNSVTSIGSGAFIRCSGLTSIVVENGNSKYDSRNDCNAIIETASNILIQGCKNTIIPNSVTSIGSYAFQGCSGLTSITIPNSVTSIGVLAFYACSGLTSVTIPNSVTSIGQSAFEGTAWFNNQPDGLVYAGKVVYKYKGEMPSNTSIIIKDGTLGIGSCAFQGCSGLTSITIPNSVTSIGYGAFRGCKGLTSVTIPNSVTSIGREAFESCSGLTSITIPNSVTSIGSDAFYRCSSLQSVYSKIENVFAINGSTFSTDTYSKAKLYVPIGKKSAYQETEGWKRFNNIEEYDYSTGIAAPQQSKGAKVVDAYQLNGQKRNGVQRGLNIVRMSDGTTKKVVVK